jgi:hypothetical protein
MNMIDFGLLGYGGFYGTILLSGVYGVDDIFEFEWISGVLTGHTESQHVAFTSF